MEWYELSSLGDSKNKAGETRDAIEYFKKALKVAQKNGSKKNEALTLDRLAEIYSDIEQYRTAVDCYEKGLEIAQETGDKELECVMCLGIGMASVFLGDHEKSMKFNKQGFIVALNMGDSNLTARSYAGLGYSYRCLCEYQNSIKCFKKAIDLYKQLNNEQLLGNCYGNLSESYRIQGKYHDALRFRENSLNFHVRFRNKKNEAVDLIGLGSIYKNLNHLDKAIEFFKKGLIISKENNYRCLQAKCYTNIGDIMFYDFNNYEKAISYYEKCLVIAVQIQDKQTQAAATINLGNCLKQLNRHKEANEHYNKSLNIAKEINDKLSEACVCLNMADTYVESDFQRAIVLAEKCLEIASSIGKDLEGNACRELGRIYMMNHILQKADNQGHQACHNTDDDNIAKSEEYLRKALDCFDFMIKHLHQRDQFKVSIFDNFIDTYKLLMIVLIEAKRPREALLVSDAGRARALGDSLLFKFGMTEQKECYLPQPITYPDVEAVVSDNSFSMLHYSLLDEVLAVWILAKDKMVVQQLINSLAACAFDKDAMVLQQLSNGLAAWVSAEDAMVQQSESAIEKLTEEDKVKDENYCFITDTVERAYEVMQIEESVTCENRSLDDYVTSKDSTNEKRTESMSRDDGTNEENLDQVLHPLEMLYNCLVAPVLTHVQHEEVVIVPDGPMYRVPFAALRDRNTGQYLSDTKRIRLAPSIAVLKVLKECPVDHHSQNGALIVGDPSVGEVMFRGKKRMFPRLRSADLEATVISYKLGQSALTGEQATKQAVLDKLREGSAVIDIASHGSSDNGEIALAPNVSSERQGIPEEDDYLLTMKEVQDIGIKAQLVVLSCCYSGRGVIRAEGMVGLSRAFLAAGARAVVASLWAIDDSVTFSFMVSFYSYLTRGESACVSLHKDMHDIRKEGHRDPKYWAPFFLIGDDVILKLR